MSFKKLLNYLLLFPIALILLVFIFANRHDTILYLNPFNPYDQKLTYEAPLFFWLLLMLMIGFVIGCFYSKIIDYKYKKAARQKQKIDR